MYAAVWGNRYPSFNVLVYAPGATSPSRTLSDSNGAPMGIAVRRDGTVIVSNYFTCVGSNCEQTGDVIAYPPGSTGSFNVYAPGYIHEPYHVAITDLNHVYVDGGNGGPPGDTLFGEYDSPARFAFIDIALNVFSQIIVDQNDDFVVAQYGTTDTVDVFAPGNLKPRRSFPMVGVPAGAAPGLAISRDNKSLYTVTEDQQGTAYIARYDYATGRPTLKPITDSGYCLGIALNPSATP